MDEDFSSDDLSSDEELQETFSRGELKPGLIVRKAPPKSFTNNVVGMKQKLSELKAKELEWIERMDVTETMPKSTLEEGEDKDILDPEDDFKREMHFFHQAQSSVLIGLRKLEKLGVPTKRPEDYFAEMVKTDDHMRRVREKLLGRQKVLEQKEKMRKMRELKKYGKKVQHEILQKRRAEKKATMEAMKKYKKGKGERPSFLARADEDQFPVTAESYKNPTKQKQTAGKRPFEKSKKQQIKDKKFGFGGKKRWTKSNTAESSADTSSFKPAINSRKKTGSSSRKDGKKKGKGDAIGGRKKNKTIRLGKRRRQKMKLKR